MLYLLIFSLLFHQVNSINLILPFDGDEDDFEISKHKSVVLHPSLQNYPTNITVYESVTHDIIKRVVFRGVQIFHEEEPINEGCGRSVHHLETEGTELVIIMPSSGPQHMEAIIWMKDFILYNLKYVKSLLDVVLEKCPEVYFNEVKKLLYRELPAIGLLYYEIQPTMNDNKHFLDQANVKCNDKTFMANKILEELVMCKIPSEDDSLSLDLEYELCCR